jgi:hypothetical protein
MWFPKLCLYLIVTSLLQQKQASLPCLGGTADDNNSKEQSSQLQQTDSINFSAVTKKPTVAFLSHAT